MRFQTSISPRLGSIGLVITLGAALMAACSAPAAAPPTSAPATQSAASKPAAAPTATVAVPPAAASPAVLQSAGSPVAAASPAAKPAASAATPPPAGGAASKPAAATGGQTYTVKDRDNLATIAEDVYGDPKLWRTIYLANQEIIGSNAEADLKTGTVLQIPPKP
jgi:nucleoid-associated protein YgaU